MTLRKAAVASIAVLLSLLAPAAAPAASGRVQGKVMSGKVPLGDFRVQLMQARPGAKRPQVIGTARSKPGGRFVLRYRRAARNAAHYLIANRPGGGAEAGYAVPARAYRLASSLGTGAVPPRVTVNDRTTVAMAFTLAQFLAGPRVTGENPGLKNAAAMSGDLVDPRSGQVAPVLRRFPNGNSTSTLATFDSLANLVATCRLQGGACAKLLALGRVPGRGAAADTLRALAAIATNPWHNAGALFRRSLRARKAYRPFLANGERPDAWTLALRFEGERGTMNGPGNFAIDSGGDLWVTNNYTHSRDPDASVCSSEQLLRFTPTGQSYPGSPYEGGGLSGAGFGIGFDPRGRLWVGNFGFAGAGCEEVAPSNSVSLFEGSGTPLSPSFHEPEDEPGVVRGGLEAGEISFPQGTVSDLDGNIWIANCGDDSVTRYANGLPERATNLGDVGLERPFGVAAGRRGHVFVTGNGNSRVSVIEPDGSVDGVVDGHGLDRPLGVATDSRGYVWVANSGKVVVPCKGAPLSLAAGPERGTVTLLKPGGAPIRSFEGAGLSTPWGVAVDGDDTVWVANFSGQRLSQLCGTRSRRCPAGKRHTGASISPFESGYGFDGLTRNTGVAIDPSGNVWLANNWRQDLDLTNPGGHQIVAYLGLATPIRTPLVGPPEQP